MALTIQPTGSTLGATITDVDLAMLDGLGSREVDEAFNESALLIFPGQALSENAQISFAKRFGEIEILDENTMTIPLTNKGADGKLLADDTYRMKLLAGNEGRHTDS